MRGITMPQYNNTKSELDLMCGMFRHESKNGEVYYNGKDQNTGEEFVMFKNSYYEEGDNKPYFRLMRKAKSGAAPKKQLED